MVVAAILVNGNCRGGFRDSIITHTPNKTTKPALSPPPDHEIYSNISRDRTPIIPIL
ncbi:MAG: hypothetical protein RIG66_07795 [Coleofasciculus sp. E2-BRE-01]